MAAIGTMHILTKFYVCALPSSQKESKLEEGEEEEGEGEEEGGVIKVETHSGREKGSRLKKGEGASASHQKPEEEEQSVPRTKRNRTGDDTIMIMIHNNVSCLMWHES